MRSILYKYVLIKDEKGKWVRVARVYSDSKVSRLREHEAAEESARKSLKQDYAGSILLKMDNS